MNEINDSVQSSASGTGPTVYYDGGCPICRREISVYKGMVDDDVRWCDVNAIDAGELDADGLDRDRLLARFHVRRADGEVVAGTRAFLAVWQRTRRLGWLGRALDRQPFVVAGDVLYEAFLAIRPLWRRSKAAG